MAISRRRAASIHEAVFYALWGTGVSCVAALAAGASNLIQAGLIVSAIMLFIVWLLLPPVPKYKSKKKSASRKKTSTKRKRKR